MPGHCSKCYAGVLAPRPVRRVDTPSFHPVIDASRDDADEFLADVMPGVAAHPDVVTAESQGGSTHC